MRRLDASHLPQSPGVPLLKERRAFIESTGYNGIKAPSSRSVKGGEADTSSRIILLVAPRITSRPLTLLEATNIMANFGIQDRPRIGRDVAGVRLIVESRSAGQDASREKPRVLSSAEAYSLGGSEP